MSVLFYVNAIQACHYGSKLDGSVEIEPSTSNAVQANQENCLRSGEVDDHFSEAPSPLTPSPCTSDYNSLELADQLKDPAKWPNDSDSFRVEVIKRGPYLVSNFKGPQNSQNRRFSSEYCTRRLENGESVARKWLVYSKSSDKVFCFCCKLFS